MLSSYQLQNALAAAHAKLQAGDAKGSEQAIRGLLAQAPGEVNSLHLLGLALKAQGRLNDARAALEGAIKGGGDPIAIGNSLAGVDYAAGDLNAALEGYENVLERNAHHADALYNAALCAIALEDGPKARLHAKQGRKVYPQLGKFRYVEARALELCGELKAAEDAYKAHLALEPSYFHSLYALGILQRRSGRFDDARNTLLRATALHPSSLDAWFVLANIHYQLGEAEDADIAFRRVLTLDPAHVETHTFLNNLYAEYGFADKYGKSFNLGKTHAPQSIPLRLAEIDALLLAERFDDCEAALTDAYAALGRRPELLVQAGRLAARREDFETAAEALGEARAQSPDAPALAISHARHLLCCDLVNEAHTALDVAEPLLPHDQNLWALRGTAWHMDGKDDKAEWLFGYIKIVRAMTLGTPPGYKTLQSFLDHLQETLETQHTASRAPLNQTLRNGTQTVGKLFELDNPVIRTYRDALRQTVHTFIADLPNDETHPFLRRKNKDFDFASSWSVRLEKTGYHVSHVHPLGWLSSAFYVAFDEHTVSPDPENPAGWLHFGIPGFKTPRTLEAARKVRPEPGLLALFPSYCWHGTYAVEEDGMRMTAPFDVVPTA